MPNSQERDQISAPESAFPSQDLAKAFRQALISAPTSQTYIEGQIVAVKELRRDIDAQLQKLKGLPKSRENSLAITKLQEGIMWLGMSLKELNQLLPAPAPSPYPSSYDPSTPKVEPVADGLKL